MSTTETRSPHLVIPDAPKRDTFLSKFAIIMPQPRNRALHYPMNRQRGHLFARLVFLLLSFLFPRPISAFRNPAHEPALIRIVPRFGPFGQLADGVTPCSRMPLGNAADNLFTMPAFFCTTRGASELGAANAHFITAFPDEYVILRKSTGFATDVATRPRSLKEAHLGLRLGSFRRANGLSQFHSASCHVQVARVVRNGSLASTGNRQYLSFIALCAFALWCHRNFYGTALPLARLPPLLGGLWSADFFSQEFLSVSLEGAMTI